MRILLAGPIREQSRGEEIANSISHGIALIAAFVGGPFLIMHAASHANTGFLIGTCLFSATTILLYLSSTLYHAFPAGKTKLIFRTFEHSAIFLLIAGTYTPFTLGVLRGAWGWTLFGVVWSLAIAGVALKVFAKRPHPVLSTGLYLLMGWLVVVAIEPLSARIPPAGLSWLVAGGLSYTVGVVFFATDSRLLYGHFIWHLFVIAGTTCHFIAVLWYGA
ncbi:hemolysin III [Nitrosospira briensis]|uniref:Hemolysin III n=1 Tax=Nitrosospira briensis TaxID=35799 RepID=A0A1I5ED49_9PROT|nr:hemolysin III family protein [Nitrosospira briensis]SFO09365.1 hemolysin III [Nitrosospira briensis]